MLGKDYWCLFGLPDLQQNIVLWGNIWKDIIGEKPQKAKMLARANGYTTSNDHKT